MSDTDFYNRNMYRSYPFKDSPWQMPSVGDNRWREGVVDVGVVFLPSADFDPSDSSHRIYPSRVTKSGITTQVELKIVATGSVLDGTTIVASADNVDRYGLIPFTLDYAAERVAFGFVIIGDDTNFPSSDSALVIDTATATYVEPRCIQSLEHHFVNHLSIANEPRTVAVADSASSSSAASSDDYAFAPSGQGITGDVQFVEGCNVDITLVGNTNAIRFSARRGAGAGEPCEEIPRTVEEQDRIDAGLTLDRAVRCHEVFSNINGVAPNASGNFSLIAQRGVEITSPAAHRLQIAGRDDLGETAP